MIILFAAVTDVYHRENRGVHKEQKGLLPSTDCQAAHPF